MKRGLITLFLILVSCTGTVNVDSNNGLVGPTLPPPSLATNIPPNAEITAADYLKSWEGGDFVRMYELLSPLSKDAINMEDFVATYQAVNESGSFVRVQTSILSSQQNNSEAQTQFSLILHSSLFGKIHRQITIPLLLEKGKWVINWDHSLILPELANGNTLYMDYVIPARANIYDRNGLAFAAHTDAVSIGVIPGKIDSAQENQLLEDLSPLISRHPEAIKSLYSSAKPDWYVPLGEASSSEIKAIYDRLNSYSGLVMKPYKTRYYVGGKLGAPHAVGYTALIPEEQAQHYKSMGYRGDEFVGVQGLEAWGEEYLSGKRGGALHVASMEGQWVATLAESQSSPAQAIYTTLDRNFQREVQIALQDLVGAAIVINMQTGEVLAMASSPSFDPNLFDPANYNIVQLEETISNPYRPLINRVTQGQYAPGSTFKVVTMASALESGLFNAEQIYYCGHSWNGLGTAYTKYDWTSEKGYAPSGNLNIIGALRRSCNPWFYQIGLSLHNWADYFLPDMSRKFGLGIPTGIIGLQQSINEEVGGIIPSEDWATSAGILWTPANTVHMAIGQGDMQVTPLQMAQLYAALGNGGTIYRPQLVRSIASPDQSPIFEFQPEAVSRLPVSDGTLSAVRQGLWEVVNDSSGTANYRFRSMDIPIYGKTGTAEDRPRKPHAWFAGFTDAGRPDLPDFAAVIILENKGEGSEWAAPIFRRLVEVYFHDEIRELYPWEVEIGLTATPSPTLVPIPVLHVVIAGDSLGGLSNLYKVPLADIMIANELDNPNVLSPGQELVIPLGGIENLTPTPTSTLEINISGTPQP
jgi:penicillin-binding protein 2